MCSKIIISDLGFLGKIEKTYINSWSIETLFFLSSVQFQLPSDWKPSNLRLLLRRRIQGSDHLSFLLPSLSSTIISPFTTNPKKTNSFSSYLLFYHKFSYNKTKIPKHSSSYFFHTINFSSFFFCSSCCYCFFLNNRGEGSESKTKKNLKIFWKKKKKRTPNISPSFSLSPPWLRFHLNLKFLTPAPIRLPMEAQISMSPPPCMLGILTLTSPIPSFMIFLIRWGRWFLLGFAGI